MADQKISQLTDGTPLQDDDLVVISRLISGSYQNRKAKYNVPTKTTIGLENVPNIDATKASNDIVDGDFDTIDSAVASGDTVKTALEKLQGQVNNRLSEIASYVNNNILTVINGIPVDSGKKFTTVLDGTSTANDIPVATTIKSALDEKMDLVDDAILNNLAAFLANGQVKDSGVSISTDPSLGGDSPSDSLLSTQKAIKEFIASILSGTLRQLGNWDAATNNPHLEDGTGLAGDMYFVSVAGTQDLGHGDVNYNLNDIVYYTINETWERLAGQSLSALSEGCIWIGNNLGIPQEVNLKTAIYDNLKVLIYVDENDPIIRGNPNDFVPYYVIATKAIEAGAVYGNDTALERLPMALSPDRQYRNILKNITYVIEDANFSFASNSTKDILVHTGFYGQNRTYTLPPANTRPAGHIIWIADSTGTAGEHNYDAIVNCSGSDTLNGYPSVTFENGFFVKAFIGDGVSKWTFDTDGYHLKALNGANIIDGSVTFAKLSNIATNSVLGRKTSGTGTIEILSGFDILSMLTTATTKTITNENYTFTSSDRTVINLANLTSSRTITLPAANTLPLGTELSVIDASRTISSTAPLTVAASGSDTINGNANIASNSPLNNVLKFIVTDNSNPGKFIYIGNTNTTTRTITSNYSVVDSDYLIICNNTADITVTLPNAIGRSGKQFIIKIINTGKVTIKGNIDNVTSVVVDMRWAALTVQSNDSIWLIV